MPDLPPNPEPLVAVLRLRGQFQLVAVRRIARDEVILHLEGIVVLRPTRHTIQVGRDQHLEAIDPDRLEAALDEHAWRFLNHSCAPNARVEGRMLVAMGPIEAGDQVTFDYTTTEYELACPFACGCGAVECIGMVRGYRHLTEEQQRRRQAYVAPHLREWHMDRRICANGPR